jgi:hypothetical protein
MPRSGAITLSDVAEPALRIVCEPCKRRGSYGVRRLLTKHGDALASLGSAKSLSGEWRTMTAFS